MTEISKIIRDRWSPREYDPDFSISSEEMNQILEAARWAPSAMNTQEWWFVPGIRGDKNYEVLRRAVAGFSDWALDASGLILNIHQEYPSRHGLDFGPYDLGSAVQNMLLQAEVMGMHMRPFATFDREGNANRCSSYCGKTTRLNPGMPYRCYPVSSAFLKAASWSRLP